MEHVPLAYITELLYPPVSLPPQALKELYLRISGPFGFTEFKILPDGRGATLQTERKKGLSILPEKLTYREERTEQTVESFASEVGDVARQIREHLRIPVFVSQTAIIRLLAPLVGGENAASLIGSRLLAFGRPRMEVFGRPVTGVGLRFVFPATRERLNEFQVRIEPYFQDLRMLFLENTARFFQPPQAAGQVEENVRAAYQFLTAETTEFLEGILGNRAP